MHHFQLKPVRSLDSLRSAWSGHLRHGPPPNVIVTNPYEIPSVKSILSSSHPFSLNDSNNQSNIMLNISDTNTISGTGTAFNFNSLVTESNRIVQEIDKTSFMPVSSISSCTQIIQPNQFLHELHNDLTKSVTNSLSHISKNDTTSEKQISPKDTKLNIKDVSINIDSASITWNNQTFDDPFKSSNFLHQINENDPFDTSKVFTPSYLQTTLLKSTIPSSPIQFQPLSHPSNSTSCSAHAKVNIIVHYVLCL